MASNKYLGQNYSSIGELKKDYFQMAKKLHPDHGGSNEAMQALNNEYEYAVKHMETETSKAGFVNSKHRDVYRHNYYDFDNDFINMINDLLKVKKAMPGIEIEICGFFIYVHNTDKKDKDIFNKNGLGLIYHGQKNAWYYKPSWYYKKSGSTWNMDQIREKYGSMSVNNDNNMVTA